MPDLVAFRTAQESLPRQGNRELPITLAFTNTVTQVVQDLSQVMRQSQIETLQSIWIDNTANGTKFSIQFANSGQKITVGPYTQGLYPVIDWGTTSFTATCLGQNSVPVIFSNTAKRYFQWTPGV